VAENTALSVCLPGSTIPLVIRAISGAFVIVRKTTGAKDVGVPWWQQSEADEVGLKIAGPRRL